jgi:hypothetical protein
VVRDRLMARLAARYPGYGWEHNAGYSTPTHRAAIRRLGLTPFHRRSFAPARAILLGEQLQFDLDEVALETVEASEVEHAEEIGRLDEVDLTVASAPA